MRVPHDVQNAAPDGASAAPFGRFIGVRLETDFAPRIVTESGKQFA
jgi:hypothetical protein